MGGGYHSIRSEDFDRHLREDLADRVRTQSPVAEVAATHVVLQSGERLEAKAVIDGRGTNLAFPCGYQKFLGQDLVPYRRRSREEAGATETDEASRPPLRLGESADARLRGSKRA